MATVGYLSEDVLKGFSSYKYSAVDTSPISNYVCHPFWNTVVKFVPLSVAPNVLTLSGFLMLLFNFLLLSYYDSQFLASTHDHPHHAIIPDWVWLMSAVFTFLAHTLDGIDGKHARRTNTSSPLGELFDHGLDSWAVLFLPVSVYSIFGRGEFGTGVYPFFLLLVCLMLSFVMSHWEKYNTGVLFLPWSYDIGQIVIMVMHLLTFCFGYSFWRFHLPVMHVTAADFFMTLTYLGLILLTIPMTFFNIYQSYAQKTGRGHAAGEAVRPLVSTVLLLTLMVLWATFSPTDIADRHSRLFLWTTGTAFSNIACHLIIAQMSRTRCQLVSSILYPLMCVVGSSLMLQLQSVETCLLWIYCAFITTVHMHFGVSVIREMCVHLKINAFSISVVSNGAAHLD